MKQPIRALLSVELTLNISGNSTEEVAENPELVGQVANSQRDTDNGHWKKTQKIWHWVLGRTVGPTTLSIESNTTPDIDAAFLDLLTCNHSMHDFSVFCHFNMHDFFILLTEIEY